MTFGTEVQTTFTQVTLKLAVPNAQNFLVAVRALRSDIFSLFKQDHVIDLHQNKDT